MSTAISEDHLALLDAVRRFAGDRCPPSEVRAAMEKPPADRPSFWAELAALGWLGLAVTEEVGGEGYGHLEAAVVLDGLGGAVVPGPALPTIWAAGVLSAAPERSERIAAELADLARGSRVGTVARSATVVATEDGAGLRVTGSTAPVLSGAMADLAVIPLDTGEWCLVDLAVATATSLDSLDPTRALATLELVDAPAVRLAGLTAEIVDQVGLAMAAAELAGVAGWCVDTAATYAKDRRQFGRPIGQFQAVKHKCADMLVLAEQIRAVAWDAAIALDGEDPHGPAGRLSAAAAGAVALEACATVAKDCIQVLGGIGFTWEHDAHLYLRRAVTLRQLFEGSSPWRAATARAALDGVRRTLAFDLPPEAEVFRAQIVPIVDEIAELPKDERRVPLADAGLIVPHWAEPWGRDAGPVEQLVIDQELRRAKVRVPHLNIGAWAAPTVAAYGTEEQQERWVRPTLYGEIAWCQLFSEPEAGSDLAGLTTTATRAEGGWLLNGQKVWTSFAREADWGICLARTDPSKPKHLGITYFIVDMRTPGIDIRPLRELTGMEMFNEVFLDDVFVPDDGVIGDVDGGWPLARTTLANERVSMGSGSSFGGGIETLIGMVAERVGDGRLVADPLLLDRLGELVAEAHSLAVMGLRTTVRSVTGAKPGPEVSVRKLRGVEHDQRTQELGLLLLGPEGAANVGAGAQWQFGFLANRCLSIAGGTSEIQRNVIGERLLGLPRDPE